MFLFMRQRSKRKDVKQKATMYIGTEHARDRGVTGTEGSQVQKGHRDRRVIGTEGSQGQKGHRDRGVMAVDLKISIHVQSMIHEPL
jgi:hypothetical protein